MRAINHALTGAVIGLTVGEAAVAVPVALASHFVCDAIPHYDGAPLYASKAAWARTKLFKGLLVGDAVLCTALVLVLVLIRPSHWVMAAVCAFVAAAPDFLWLGRYVSALKEREHRDSRFSKFAADIQWFEQPIGAAVEVTWFAAGLLLIWPFLAR
jgi:hypothetical protein